MSRGVGIWTALRRRLICSWLHRWRPQPHLCGPISEASTRTESWTRSVCSACRGLDIPTPAWPSRSRGAFGLASYLLHSLREQDPREKVPGQ